MQEQQTQNDNLNKDAKQPTSKSKNILKIASIVAGVVVFIGICSVTAFGYYNNKIAQEYENKFLPNTYINGISVDKQSVDEVVQQIEAAPKEKSVVIDDGENKITITGEDIEMTTEKNKIEELLASQDNHEWLKAKFGEKEEMEVSVDYNMELLRQKINELQCVSDTRQEPVNATIEKVEGEFRLVPSISGNKADAQVLFDEACELFDNGGGKIDATKTYKQPEIKDDDSKLNETLNKLNGYLNADIVYNIDGIDDAERLHKEEIETMLVFDAETLDVSFDDEAIREWLREIGKKYDTVGKTKIYTIPGGETIELSGGTLGWEIDEAAEFEKVKEDILSGEKIDRDFTYVKEALGPKDGQEWGNTYVDADLSEQHGIFIRNGEIAYEWDFVSGTDIPSRRTAVGFHPIYWMESPHVMKGEIDPATGKPEYETPCDYFICFYRGMAIHDADHIRSDWSKLAWVNFMGSHGCLNSHYEDAKWLYNNLDYGVPVIVHE